MVIVNYSNDKNRRELLSFILSYILISLAFVYFIISLILFIGTIIVKKTIKIVIIANKGFDGKISTSSLKPKGEEPSLITFPSFNALFSAFSIGPKSLKEKAIKNPKKKQKIG